jgi:hypothetical protein
MFTRNDGTEHRCTIDGTQIQWLIKHLEDAKQYRNEGVGVLGSPDGVCAM